MNRSLSRSLLATALIASSAATVLAPRAAAATPSLDDYRHFRAISIDLAGRIPTRAEIAAFEQPGFDLDGWIDAHLAGDAYAERVRRVYMDLLRLQIGGSFQFVPNPVTLRRVSVTGPDGRPVYVYFRNGQRRNRADTDGVFCLSRADSGLQFPSNANPTGTAIPVTQALLDQYTVLVRPWWLYRDHRSASPADRITPSGFTGDEAGFVPSPGLLVEPDGVTPTVAVRVCREEALTASTGTVFAPGWPAVARGAPPPYGRLSNPPSDPAYAHAHPGAAIDCGSNTAYALSADCGCGAGLERCMPNDGSGFESRAFTVTTRDPLGPALPFEQQVQPASWWLRYWWGEEARRYLDAVLTDDRDFRDVLRGRDTYVNGPLAQFYRSIVPSTCCSNAATFNYLAPQPLFDTSALPSDLLPQSSDRWVHVTDRGENASGILTMPVFLTKYGSRRARAHVLYQAFLCRDFVAGSVQLMPSTEPNLMIRPGCATCHATLEPMAAYFTRVLESDWSFLPPSLFPAHGATCALDAASHQPSGCSTYYDLAFSDRTSGMLRGAYGSLAHADAGPRALADELVADPTFASCVTSNVASSFLGRPLGADDAALATTLQTAFVSGGYRMRALVRALVRADVYRRANNMRRPAASVQDGGAQ